MGDGGGTLPHQSKKTKSPIKSKPLCQSRPPTKSLFLPMKIVVPTPYCYLKWDIKILKKVIKMYKITQVSRKF